MAVVGKWYPRKLAAAVICGLPSGGYELVRQPIFCAADSKFYCVFKNSSSAVKIRELFKTTDLVNQAGATKVDAEGAFYYNGYIYFLGASAAYTPCIYKANVSTWAVSTVLALDTGDVDWTSASMIFDGSDYIYIIEDYPAALIHTRATKRYRISTTAVSTLESTAIGGSPAAHATYALGIAGTDFYYIQDDSTRRKVPVAGGASSDTTWVVWDNGFHTKGSTTMYDADESWSGDLGAYCPTHDYRDSRIVVIDGTTPRFITSVASATYYLEGTTLKYTDSSEIFTWGGSAHRSDKTVADIQCPAVTGQGRILRATGREVT